MSAMTNKRILIVEDEVLMGGVVADLITEAGGRPIGPVLNEEEALDLLAYDRVPPDAAVLDLRATGSAGALADRLREMAVPFIFAAVLPGVAPAPHGDNPVCTKPYTPSELYAALKAAFEQPAAS
jgi:DNA-binding response OmpR family regulator